MFKTNIKPSVQKPLSFITGALVVMYLLLSATGCGFHLRGSQSPTFNNPNIVLSIVPSQSDNPTENRNNKKINQRLKEQVVIKLTRLGALVDETNNTEIMLDKTYVNISNIHIKKHKLVGTLTEIQLILTADIQLSTNNKAPKIARLQTQRSYQLNQATVNTNDANYDNLIHLMYQEMADKVSHQIALYEKTN